MIMITRETLLFSDGEAWVKKNEEDAFDVPMGLYDGAEMCELVGTYLLNQLVFSGTNSELTETLRDLECMNFIFYKNKLYFLYILT